MDQRRRGARLRAYPRRRADPAQPSSITLEDFRSPAPPGWTGTHFSVDELPDERPVTPGEEVEP